MIYINREEAIRLIMEYQGGAMDKPTARKVLEGMDGIEICEDTISRQAAIDGFYEMASDMDHLCTVSDYVSFLESLPSAQPEPLTVTIDYEPSKDVCDRLKQAMRDAPILLLPSEIIRCKDCKFWTHIKRTNRYWCKTDDGLYDLNPSPDDFCSRAERRTDGVDR